MLTGSFPGKWWLPDAEDRPVFGTLQLEWGQSPRLELIGSLVGPEAFGEEERHPIILGSTSDGKRVTLDDCLTTNLHFSLGAFDLPTVQMVASVALIGAHVGDVDGQRFGRCRLEVERLTDWLQPPAMTQEVETADSGRRLVSARLVFRLPPLIESSIGPARLTFGFSWSSRGDLRHEASFVQEGGLAMSHEAGLTLEEWLQDYVTPLCNLVSLATERRASVVRLVLSEPQTAEGSASDGSEVEAIWRREAPDPDPPRLLLPPEMVFGIRDFDDVTASLGRWFTASDELGDAVNLFFGVRVAETMYTENRFLNLTQAAEVYHRRRFGGTDLPADEHRARLAGVLGAAPPAHRQWLEERLRYSDEPTLRRRLRELYRLARPVMAPLAGDGRAFIDQVVKARNFHTHWDTTARGQVLRGAGLWHLSELVGLLVAGCLLTELGFTAERASDLLRSGSGAYRSAAWRVQRS